MSREAKVLVAILVIVIGGMVAAFALTNKPQTTTGPTADANKLVTDTSHKQGTGSVTVVEFGDYQCPACGQAYPIMKQLQQEYGNKITFVFRNYPLAMHPNAPAAAAAAEAAGLQGKFWEMHDRLYENQSQWSDVSGAAASDIFVGYAKDLGLDVEKFKQDVASETVKNIIATDKSDGDALGIQATPTFYVNGQQALDYSHDTLKSIIDEQLKKK